MASRTNSKASFSVTIASSGDTSDAATLEDFVLCGFILPATFTGTTVSFQGSLDNSTFYDIYNSDNTVLTATVTQNRAYSLNVIDFAVWPYIKIKSGATETGERSITLLASRALERR